MGCDCTTARHDVTLMDDNVMVAYASIESRCEPNRIVDPGTGEEVAPPRNDSGARGCRVVYTITAGQLNLPNQLELIEFATASFAYGFEPPLAPLQAKTLSYNTPTTAADCRVEPTGRFTFRRPGGTSSIVIGGIPVCVPASR